MKAVKGNPYGTNFYESKKQKADNEKKKSATNELLNDISNELKNISETLSDMLNKIEKDS